MSHLHQRIADMEAEIERLSEQTQRCRKIELAAKAAVLAGGILLFSLVTGLLRSDPLVLVLGIAAVLGGIVLFGSNQSTLVEITATIRQHEARRRELIDQIELQPVK